MMKYANTGCQPHTVKMFCAEVKKNFQPSITKRAPINCSHDFSLDRLHRSFMALDTLYWKSCTNDTLGRKLQANEMYPCAEIQNNSFVFCYQMGWHDVQDGKMCSGGGHLLLFTLWINNVLK